MNRVNVSEITEYLLYSRHEVKEDPRSYAERNNEIIHQINRCIAESDVKHEEEISDLLARLSELHFETGMRAGFQLAADMMKTDN